jgi:hypothetical protein
MVPFSYYTLTEFQKPEVFKSLNWSVAMMLGMPAWAILDKRWPVVCPDYVLAVADKPFAAPRLPAPLTSARPSSC